ncbi:cation chloride cotransporter [Purpureocillium lavendulum]|uniref:Cation chloride cotransporter n=1 Tax=Purpureocillium lavendulum TaxID=1247861 RepID=A0AB34FIK4_9HYPO|nr:cation chloride cotransporter [Purpureocillium lavendulum]
MPSPDDKAGLSPAAAGEPKKGTKLGLVSGVYIPVCLNIMSILMFLRFGLILGQVGFMGILGLLVTAYCVDLLTTLSLSAIASNGEVKGGGAYYLISRSLGPEFGGSIGILFFLAQALNTAMNIVGLIDCIRLNVGPSFPAGYWTGYGLQTAALLLCTGLCLLGSATFSKASNALLAILTLAVVSIPVSAVLKAPFRDETTGVVFTGFSLETLAANFLPHTESSSYNGLSTFRDLFGILFPATSGIFAGASMSGDLKDPSRAIPSGTLWAMLTTFIVYFVVVLSMAASTTHASFLANANVIPLTNLSPPIILAGECAVTLFSALMGIIGSAKLFQALAKDKLLPGLAVFGKGTKKADEPILAIFLTYAIAQVALLADLNQIATFISMGYQMTFFVMNLACFLLKIGSAPNFRPGFKLFNWQTALVGSLLSAGAMFFIDETYASIAICVLIFIFLLIHYLCPPKRWGDVSQNLIYHQVRKYLLRLKPEHIKFWRPHIILLINNPRRQARLIQFCNSMKKGSLYILGHVIVSDDFNSGVHEARLQQQAWTKYISEFSRIKAFVQLTMSPSITWGIRNLILSAGLGGMRPNIAVMGFYNMDDLRRSGSSFAIPEIPASPAAKMRRPQKAEDKAPMSKRRRGDTSARLLEGVLPTDAMRTEEMMSPTEYMIMLEDLALKYRLNVAVAHGFDKLESPRKDGLNTKKYVDLWPIQMSAEVSSDGKNVLTTNFDTYTLILQLGHILQSVRTWKRVYALRVMVFVEYESEVEEERARVNALLEKLRIDAEVLVFWLASGHLNTYELIVNGHTNDIDTEIVVSDALKDEEWWETLQGFRGQAEQMSASQEMNQINQIIGSAGGRVELQGEGDFDRRRSSVAELANVLKKPDITTLSRLGVNPGIHTHHLADEVFQEEPSDEEWSTESELSDTEDGFEFGGSQFSILGQGDVSLSIPELVESYKQDSHADEPEAGSSYSTQGVSLSFNDLPCRAQHLILNELMRQHSKETAVLMSTLPIPSEGTCLDESESIQYLSDIEVLCNELPPTLMILSNNMTVTTVDQVISQLCQICHQDTALSTGFCWRCEHMWDSLLTGSSTFVPRPTKAPEPNVPPVASSSSSSSTARRHGRASSWTSCVSTVASQYNEDFDPGLPSPTLPDTQHYSAARPSLMVEPLRVNSPPSSGSETDDKPAHRPPSVGQEREGPRCAIRRGYAPGLLQQRSLARTPEAFDPELLAPAARSLLPSWLKRKPSLRRRSESRMYENMSYYFDDSNFKKPVDIKVVEMRSAPPPDAERSARFVASGSSGWI